MTCTALTVMETWPPSLLIRSYPQYHLRNLWLRFILKKQGGFSKTSVAAVPMVPTLSSGNVSPRPHQTPLELGLMTQKVFRSFCIFCHGLLAGLACWQVFTIYVLHKDDLEFVSLYSPSPNLSKLLTPMWRTSSACISTTPPSLTAWKRKIFPTSWRLGRYDKKTIKNTHQKYLFRLKVLQDILLLFLDGLLCHSVLLQIYRVYPFTITFV